MAIEIRFEKIERAEAKVASSNPKVASKKWWDFIAVTKSGTRYKMNFPLIDGAIADNFEKGLLKRGFIYADAWKEIK